MIFRQSQENGLAGIKKDKDRKSNRTWQKKHEWVGQDKRRQASHSWCEKWVKEVSERVESALNCRHEGSEGRGFIIYKKIFTLHLQHK